ncbi:zinc ribbon domain-containing protein [Nitrosopumilus sp.]|uniref:zinc ribbon domain-containing protein n=1 Tax=Nitrosopumilus sp. TaxID=2024843 RepID=UPI00247C0378|nr:zinc ribbon domain-containing protein [Nitrosopumilus sp.]MCV0410063.1 zinc ribbon domain-containing protein [Nitrosopumilus sp.]
MDSSDIVDDVNALLKLGVGDAYRLEHIKQGYIENKTIWVTDQNYLQRMKEKYLIKQQSDKNADTDETIDVDLKNRETIHCWKCGKKTPLEANFCMICGSSLFEVGSNHNQKEKTSNSMNQMKGKSLKLPIIIGIPVLILIVLGGAYSQGVFDNTFERYDTADSKKDDLTSKNTIPKGSSVNTVTDSKCGKGTVFDVETNSCVLDNGVSQDIVNSKCGKGTVFDVETNSCVLDK